MAKLKDTAIPISEARAELPEIIEKIEKLHDHYFITRRGKVAAVIMSTEEFESWNETLDILSNRAEMRAMQRSLKQIAKGQYKTYKEVFGEELK
jgi:prevent-host-death family protein